MQISDVTSTELFGGSPARPLAIVRVTLDGEDSGTAGRRPGCREPGHRPGRGPRGDHPAARGGNRAGTGRTPGCRGRDRGRGPARGGRPGAGHRHRREPGGGLRAERAATVSTGEPGWTMWMVSHFHYDPVWWSTQGQFTESRIFLPDADGHVPDTRVAFELVRLHLDEARRDPDYKFVLAEIDYLKPHFDAHPEDRADLLTFIKAGRIEIVGGTYNEPNTNLTCAESTIRNAIYGLAFQREVLGADPSTAWMLDAFGLDPAFPGLMAAAGMTESSWARGPFHQWGPNGWSAATERMQFAVRVRVAVPGRSRPADQLHGQPLRRGLGHQHAADLEAAEQAAYEQFRQLAPVAATRNVMLPVGADHVIPSRWVTAIHRDWNERYVWPRFVTALPREFFARGARGRGRARRLDHPADPGHEPGLHRQGRVLHRHQAGPAGRRDRDVTDGERLATLAWLTGRRRTRRRRWTRRGGSWCSARTTTRSPASRATRSTWTCWPAGGRPSSAATRPGWAPRATWPGWRPPRPWPARTPGRAGPGGRGLFNTLSRPRVGPGQRSRWSSPAGARPGRAGRRRRRRGARAWPRASPGTRTAHWPASP